MGNAESGPSEVGDRPGLDSANSLIDVPEGSDEDGHGGDDDWDYAMDTSDENFSPNKDRARFVIPKVVDTSHDHPYSPNGPSPTKKASSPSKRPSPHRRAPRDPDEDRFLVLEEDGDSDSDSPNNESEESDEDETLSVLMDTSAVVFDFLANGEMATDDEISVADRSSAVFELLQKEAREGNERPMREFLETAQIVSDVLMEEEYVSPIERYYQSNDDDQSISQQRSGIFKVLERAASNDNLSISQRSAHVIQWFETNQNDDDQSVVSEMSAGIFKVLEDAKEKVDEDEISEFSAAVFKLLDHDNQHRNDDDAQSISERSAAIFRVLDGTPTPDVATRIKSSNSKPSSPSTKRITPPPGMSMITGSRTVASHLSPRMDSSSLKQRNIFHILSQRGQATPVIPEEEAVVPEVPPSMFSTYSPVKNVVQPYNGNDSPEDHSSEDEDADEEMPAEVEDGQSETSSVYSEVTEQQQQQQQQQQPRHVFSEVIHADSSEQEIQDEIDLVFVERFDAVFNNFIGRNPKFLMSNPDLVHQLRIAKLQKLLEHMEDQEYSLFTQLSHAKGEKQNMENDYQWKLRQASRKKAARQINLQSDLAAITQKTKHKEAQMTWKVVDSSEARAKKQYQYLQSQKTQKAAFAENTFSGVPTREELIGLVPDDVEGKALNTAIFANRRFTAPSHEDEKAQTEQLRKYQVENAFMSSEIAVLKKKLSYLQIDSRKQAWADSILLRMNKVQMAKLKNKFMTKLGVSSL